MYTFLWLLRKCGEMEIERTEQSKISKNVPKALNYVTVYQDQNGNYGYMKNEIK